MLVPKVAKPQTKAADCPSSKLTPQPSTLARPLASGVVDQLHMLQRSIGNQTTLRLLSQRGFGRPGKEAGGNHEQEAEANLDRTAPRRIDWSLSRISILLPDAPPPAPRLSMPPAAILQPKLAIGSVVERSPWRAQHLMHEGQRLA